MVKTFTPSQDFIVTQTETSPDSYREDPMYLEHAEPSAKTIQAILDYSRNLEVKNSKLVNTVEFIKS